MPLYRNLVWITKGMLEYTHVGFQNASRSFNIMDVDIDCSGKVYMITGADSGLGKITVLAIAKRGGTIHMVCQNHAKAEASKDEIVKTTGNENVFVHIVDLSEPPEVFKFAKDFAKLEGTLNVLVNNAWCLAREREVNAQGMEKTFATNTLGTHILTTLLIPVLNRSLEPRVIMVSSGTMLVQRLDVEDLQFQKMHRYDGIVSHAQTMRQQIILVERYAERYPGIHFSSMHPGWADTPGIRDSIPQVSDKMQRHLRTSEEAADTIVWLAVSHATLKYPAGLFFQDRKPVATHLPLARTRVPPEEEDKLMEVLDSYLQQLEG